MLNDKARNLTRNEVGYIKLIFLTRSRVNLAEFQLYARVVVDGGVF
jgi:hypothetical protein